MVQVPTRPAQSICGAAQPVDNRSKASAVSGDARRSHEPNTAFIVQWNERNTGLDVNLRGQFARIFIEPTSVRRYHFRPMIKALLLIAFPIPTWERIVATKRPWPMILFFYYLPFVLLTCLAEGYGLVKWGKPRGRFPKDVLFSVRHAVIFEIAMVLILVGIVFILAMLIKSLSETFHGRNSFNQAFTVAAYGLGPMLLFRMLDAFPDLSPWLTWGIGVFLAAAILYTGLPIVMQPDPPHALGLYLMSTLMLIFVTGLARFVTAWYLQGKFTKLDALVSTVVMQLKL
jgi:hypothetical protein